MVATNRSPLWTALMVLVALAVIIIPLSLGCLGLAGLFVVADRVQQVPTIGPLDSGAQRGPFLEIPQLAGQTVDKVAAVLGEPRFDGDFGASGGRADFLLGEFGMVAIRFERNRAVEFLITFDPPLAGTPQELLELIGLPVEKVQVVNPSVAQYAGTVNGLRIVQATVTSDRGYCEQISVLTAPR